MRPELSLEQPRTLGLHITTIALVAAAIGLLASSEGPVIATIIAGIMTLLNTGLTIWLTGRQKEARRRRKRHQEQAEDE